MKKNEIARPVVAASIAGIPCHTNRKINNAKEFLALFTSYLKVIDYPNIPTLQGLALHIGISKDALYKAQDVFPEEFAFIKTYLENFLITNALKENFHAGFAQFLLKNSYGYSAPDLEISQSATLTPEDRTKLKEELKALREKPSNS